MSQSISNGNFTDFPLRSLAALSSGGLDSAILIGDALGNGLEVYPLYVRQGMYWETTELAYLRRFLDALAAPALHELHILEVPVADLYGSHWSVTGRAVPHADSPDEAVYLPGRNVLLLAKAMLWSHLHGVPAVALGTLAANPFPDATRDFCERYEAIVNQAVAGYVRVLRPYAGMTKREVMQRGCALPLQWTFSCIEPLRDHHCGRCNKCAERRRAFEAANMADPTFYEAQP